MNGNIDIEQLVQKTKDIHVLYVEDNAQSRENTLDLLDDFFAKVYVATNGKEGLDIFEQHPIDVVITDLNMPIMNGLEMIEAIRKIDDEVQIVIISAHNELNYIFKAILIGLDSFILKPIEMHQFLQSIHKAVEKIILKRENANSLLLLKQYEEITNKSSIISKTDPLGIITYVNDNFCEISGYTKEELIGQPHSIVRHPDTPKEVFRKLWYIIKNEKKSWQGVIKNLSKDGKTYYVKSTIKPLLDDHGNILEFIALRNDISEVMSEKKQLMASLENNENMLLILVEIENFEILDRFYNDETIERIDLIFSRTILDLMPDKELFHKIYKLGEGKFALSESYGKFSDDFNIEHHLNTFIHNTKERTIQLENIEYDISVIVSYTYGNKNLYENAKYGIERAKDQKCKLICANHLVEESQQSAQNNIETIYMVKKALDNYKIVSYFQPIIDNSTQDIVKYESLVRLINEEDEIISPYKFLDISKKSSYYTKITQRVIENSFKTLDFIPHDISINLSALDIEDTFIRNLLIEMISKPQYKGRVTFELLEDEKVKDFKTITKFINMVKLLGEVKIAIDDFGSGYSNFKRVLDYNPDYLKIDASLIKNIVNDKFSRNLVETIVDFSKKQHIKTIAEYVENEDIYNVLNEIGIDYSQGYYFGKPQKLDCT
jgi:PAS domain S-box-containing protein